MSYFESVLLGDSPNLDAAGRLRVSNPITLFDNKFTYDVQPTLWEPITASGGTLAHVAAQSAVSMTVTGISGSLAALQTFQYYPYQPSKGQLLELTVRLGTRVANVRRRFGQFDANDGLFFEQDGDGIYAVLRSSVSGAVVDTRVERAAWNLDRLDGAGPSGITLNEDAVQIGVIDYLWFGVDRIRFGFKINGRVIYVHEILNANVLTTVYMRTPTLPLRYEITSTAASAGATMYAICQALVSEGGTETDRFYQFEASNAGTLRTGIGTTLTPILTIRPKLTFNSVVNRCLIIPDHYHVYGEGGSIYYRVFWRTTLTGGSFVSAATDSLVEVDTTATALSGGAPIDGGYLAIPSTGQAAQSDSLGFLAARYPICLRSDGSHHGQITVAARALSGTVSVGVSMSWKEYR